MSLSCVLYRDFALCYTGTLPYTIWGLYLVLILAFLVEIVYFLGCVATKNAKQLRLGRDWQHTAQHVTRFSFPEVSLKSDTCSSLERGKYQGGP